MFDLVSDCEDTSILALALLERVGYGVCLILFYEERHAVIGIAMKNINGSYLEKDGKKYFYLETVSSHKMRVISKEFTSIKRKLS